MGKQISGYKEKYCTMKKSVSIFVLCFLITEIGQSSRIITDFDIAKWYLDSDLVLICTINHIDTLLVSDYNSLLTNGGILNYEIIVEKYCVTIDSIIKPDKTLKSKIDTILSQEFIINKRITQDNKGKVYTIKSNGDTIYHQMEISISQFDFSDNSYFRPMLDSTHVVILTNTPKGYMIDYETVCSDSILGLIGEIKTKGHSYFDTFKKQ
jgi:hypothetical protein